MAAGGTTARARSPDGARHGAVPWNPRTPRRASRRAAAELRRDPARSDAMIAAAAQVGHETVNRARRALERLGVIEAIPVPERAQRPRPPLPSRTRAAIESGASTPRQVADAADVSCNRAGRP